VLAAHGNDYLHAGDVASPVQHYWAMAVQMQVYLVWPLLIWAAIAVARRLKRSPAAAVVLMLAVTGGASLVHSIVLTATNQPLAYYDTLARFWEFCAGGIFAVALPRLERRMAGLPRTRLVAGWVGLLGLLGFGMIVNVSSAFPGIIAAVPLTFAALIFLSHNTGSRFSTERLLSSRPLTWLGSNSYGLYLWHWPIIVLWMAHNDQTQLTTPQGIVAIEAAIVLAWLSTRFVEQPIRRATSRTAPAGRPSTFGQTWQPDRPARCTGRFSRPGDRSLGRRYPPADAGGRTSGQSRCCRAVAGVLRPAAVHHTPASADLPQRGMASVER
jgi:peptidoglycan/LPS O-acetylase OafA/YrhL